MQTTTANNTDGKATGNGKSERLRVVMRTSHTKPPTGNRSSKASKTARSGKVEQAQRREVPACTCGCECSPGKKGGRKAARKNR